MPIEIEPDEHERRILDSLRKPGESDQDLIHALIAGAGGSQGVLRPLYEVRMADWQHGLLAFALALLAFITLCDGLRWQLAASAAAGSYLYLFLMIASIAMRPATGRQPPSFLCKAWRKKNRSARLLEPLTGVPTRHWAIVVGAHAELTIRAQRTLIRAA